MYGIITAAGKGERLWPLDRELHKSMTILGGKPFLEWQVEWMKRYGVRDIIIDEGHRAEEINDYFGDGKRFGVRIKHRVDPDLSTGRLGHIKQCLEMVPEDEENVLLKASDVHTDLDLTRMKGVHTRRGLALTLFGQPLKLSVGITETDEDDIITVVKEKPTLERTSAITSIAIVQRRIHTFLPDKGDNFWGHALSFFRGSVYREKGANWWHLTDLSDAHRIDEALTHNSEHEGLMQTAARYRRMAEIVEAQAQRMELRPPRAGKERG
jgi:mannose-1-phosphate guanylyltransferase